jgi:hypothetical protein
MQIASLAPFEVNEKMRERCAATKGARTNAHHGSTICGFWVTGWTTGFPELQHLASRAWSPAQSI